MQQQITFEVDRGRHLQPDDQHGKDVIIRLAQTLDINDPTKKLSARMVQKRTGNEVLCCYKTSISELQLEYERLKAALRQDVVLEQVADECVSNAIADASETNCSGSLAVLLSVSSTAWLCCCDEHVDEDLVKINVTSEANIELWNLLCTPTPHRRSRRPTRTTAGNVPFTMTFEGTERS